MVEIEEAIQIDVYSTDDKDQKINKLQGYLGYVPGKIAKAQKDLLNKQLTILSNNEDKSASEKNILIKVGAGDEIATLEYWEKIFAALRESISALQTSIKKDMQERQLSNQTNNVN